MKVGDLVKFVVPGAHSGLLGMIVAELAAESVYTDAVSVLWSNGEFTERVLMWSLEAISESR